MAVITITMDNAVREKLASFSTFFSDTKWTGIGWSRSGETPSEELGARTKRLLEQVAMFRPMSAVRYDPTAPLEIPKVKRWELDTAIVLRLETPGGLGAYSDNNRPNGGERDELDHWSQDRLDTRHPVPSKEGAVDWPRYAPIHHGFVTPRQALAWFPRLLRRRMEDEGRVLQWTLYRVSREELRATPTQAWWPDKLEQRVDRLPLMVRGRELAAVWCRAWASELRGRPIQLRRE